MPSRISVMDIELKKLPVSGYLYSFMTYCGVS
jgi:hypothetical protein